MANTKTKPTKHQILVLKEKLRDITESLDDLVGDDSYIKKILINPLRSIIEDDGKSMDISFNFDDLIDYLGLK